jgi:predicted regulator of Ras-like GTPase activity (Roadblock/LC7/MglB family)
MPGIEETLRSLRDVQGVLGSFVVAGTGALVARDLPAVFDGDLFAEVGPRVIRLYETFLAGNEELDSAMLRYAEHKLYLRKMTWGVVGILSNVSVNLPALRMVANLVVRKIDPDVGAPPSRLTPAPPAIETPVLEARIVDSVPAPVNPPSQRPPALTPPPPVVAPDAPASPSKHVRMYRGRPVLDD